MIVNKDNNEMVWTVGKTTCGCNDGMGWDIMRILAPKDKEQMTTQNSVCASK